MRVELLGVDGSAVGWMMLHEVRDKVVVSGLAQGLTPGFHGFHIHAVGVCDPAAPTGPFMSAGGHYNPTLLSHGDHAGDMPPLLVTADGRAYTSFATDRFSLDSLRDVDGSAVMVHAGRDNLANIPARYTVGGVAGPDSTTLGTGDAGGPRGVRCDRPTRSLSSEARHGAPVAAPLGASDCSDPADAVGPLRLHRVSGTRPNA